MALLLEVRGITETKRTWWGTLNRASDAPQKFSRSVSSVATPTRATTQAMRFGAEILNTCEVTGLRVDGPVRTVLLSALMNSRVRAIV